MTITTEQLTAFCQAAEAKARAAGRTVSISFEVGRKNARIVETDGPAHRSVFCFVDMATGAILKAAGWKSPAKGVRGNIANGAADVSPYGAAYFR